MNNIANSLFAKLCVSAYQGGNVYISINQSINQYWFNESNVRTHAIDKDTRVRFKYAEGYLDGSRVNRDKQAQFRVYSQAGAVLGKKYGWGAGPSSFGRQQRCLLYTSPSPRD